MQEGQEGVRSDPGRPGDPARGDGIAQGDQIDQFPGGGIAGQPIVAAVPGLHDTVGDINDPGDPELSGPFPSRTADAVEVTAGGTEDDDRAPAAVIDDVGASFGIGPDHIGPTHDRFGALVGLQLADLFVAEELSGILRHSR